MKTINKEIKLYSVSDLKISKCIKNVLDKQYNINVDEDFGMKVSLMTIPKKTKIIGI